MKLLRNFIGRGAKVNDYKYAFHELFSMLKYEAISRAQFASFSETSLKKRILIKNQINGG